MEKENALIEMPDYLYKNPPDPRRKDIADLFSEIVNDEKNNDLFETASKTVINQTYFSFEYLENENKFNIYRGKHLTGSISNKNNYIIQNKLKRIIYYLKIIEKAVCIRNAMKSTNIKAIMNWLNINTECDIIIRLNFNKNSNYALNIKIKKKNE